jgi:hypothetical protein
VEVSTWIEMVRGVLPDTIGAYWITQLSMWQERGVRPMLEGRVHLIFKDGDLGSSITCLPCRNAVCYATSLG